MRTLGEIMEACKSGQECTSQEMMCAICVLDKLSTFDSMAVRRNAGREMEKKKPLFSWEHVYERSFNRWKQALKKNPKDYLGPDFDPLSADVQTRRQVSKRIWAKATAKKNS